MKCPKCGFVSYAGLEQCKKCGHKFASAARKDAPDLSTLFGPRSSPQSPPPAPAAPPVDPKSALESMRLETPAPEAPPPPPRPAPHDDRIQNWRDELAKRVEKFRLSRGSARRKSEASSFLKLVFDEDERPEQEPAPASPSLVADEPEFDLGSAEPSVPEQPRLAAPSEPEPPKFDEIKPPEVPTADEVPVHEGPADNHFMKLDAVPEPVNEHLAEPRNVDRSPMEILVGDEPPATQDEDDLELIVAPIGRRLLAGLTDGLILLAGGGLFALIFWRFCGGLSLVPLNLAVLAVALALVVFGYFAAFTATASATPGLLWNGCEIRSLRGTPPSVSESLWRAFGVLVSASALMLGFIWSWLDSDTLTWHDRMSGTLITPGRAATVSAPDMAPDIDD